METSSHTIRRKVLRNEAEEVVKTIIAEKATNYHVVSFKKFRTSHQGALMKSKQYENNLLLSHEKTLFHAGWIICPYVFNGNCAASKGLFPLHTKKGGTNRYSVHIGTHEKPVEPVEVEQDLGVKCRDEIFRAGGIGSYS